MGLPQGAHSTSPAAAVQGLELEWLQERPCLTNLISFYDRMPREAQRLHPINRSEPGGIVPSKVAKFSGDHVAYSTSPLGTPELPGGACNKVRRSR